MNAAGAARKDETTGTSDELLNLAERMFAERGVENVALTQIVAASSQRNRSALHYHFGSREGVLSALLDRRLAAINARREMLLDALPARPTVLAIARATVAALGQTLVEEPWGRDYISILAQVRFHPRLLGERAVLDEHLTGVRRTRRMMQQAASPLPSALVAERLTWFTDAVVFAMARWAQKTPAGPKAKAAMAVLIEELADFGAAAVAAPTHADRSEP
ncbi:MAG TPA: TetR family transcriptional regulator [Caulobacteraceae bacterium]|nr:TetR family transcriptional regulator [Caulobacteraceae bacterium]